MSKGLGWVIKLVSWGAIYFIFSMSFGGDMPFWAYILVVLLCIVIMGVVDHFVKRDEPEESAEKPVEPEKKEDSETPTE